MLYIYIMDNGNSPTFQLNIKSHLERLGLAGSTEKINFLVKECKFSRPTAGRLSKDQGSHIKFFTLRRLADVLDVPVQELFVPVN